MSNTTSSSNPLRVGVIGAGPWARLVHAPIFAADPRTELVGVWGRRHEIAAEIAAENGTTAAASLDDLFDRCDAVSVTVPPDVQVDLASRAARAGKALLLEKPIGLDLAGATRLCDVIAETGVGSQVFLTWRYSKVVRDFLAAVAAGPPPIGGRGQFVQGAMVPGHMFATPWRLEHGPLLDLGPHIIDSLDAALGSVVAVRAHGDERTWVGLLMEHESGVFSEVTLSGKATIEPARSDIEIFTGESVVEVDGQVVYGPETLSNIVGEFVATASGVPHPLDAERGLHLSKIIDLALTDLRSRR
jgi:predicted dehydrogenase